MWARSDEAARPRTIAEIACQLCRRRKVKCDRTLPHCQVCIQTNQVCEYPLRPKKPGPKIGSLQRHKRRYRDREGSSNGSSNGTNTNGSANGTNGSTNGNARNSAGRDKRASRSPGSSASEAETGEGGSGTATTNGVNGTTTNGTNSTNSTNSRARVNRRSGGKAAFESVFESVFEDDDEDEEDDDRRGSTRRESGRRTVSNTAPASTERATAERTAPEKTAHPHHHQHRTGTTSPAGTTSDEWTQRRRNSRLNINDLSFILHPSHEASTPEKDGEAGVHGVEEGDPSCRPTESHAHPSDGSPSAPSPQALSLVQQACSALGVSEAMLRASIQGYFANMVAFNLFHQPSFGDKLGAVASPVQLFALLTAMMGYAVRFQPAGTAGQAVQQTQHSQHTDTQPPPLTVHGTVNGTVSTDMDMDMDHIDPMLMAMPETPVASTGVTSATSAMPPPPPPVAAAGPPSPEHFLDMARRLIERALDECGDDPPTLVILQACIICTHCELTRGVHGRAWRSLGMCVRLAYEMNLHLVDAKASPSSTSSTSWRDAEEKRRAWWAIWEMDVFASTIRRTPTAVDWTQMETLLPVDDQDWFATSDASGASNSRETREASEARTKERTKRRRSCFMELDPVRRWKALQASGNHSPKAWFLVINSLMKDARIISSPRGVPFEEDRLAPKSASASPKRRASPPGPCPVEEARQKLEILANCVQCFVLALPAHLQYRNQFLSFGEGEATSSYNLFSGGSPPAPSLRQLHCGIYNIYVMTQLTRLMIHRYELFGSHAQHFRQATSSSALSSSTSSTTTGRGSPLDNPAVLPYFEAADNILTIVNRSCEEHIQHINPFLLSTLWLAAAVQLVRRHVAVPRSRKQAAERRSLSAATHQQTLIKSRFDVLYLTYKRCAAFWNARTAMEQNLEALETQLEGDQGGEEEEEEASDVEEVAVEAGHNKRERSVVNGRADNDDHQRKKKKTRVVKEKEKPGRINGTTGRVQATRHAPTTDDRQQYTSWTRSSSQPQLSPASLPPAPSQQQAQWQSQAQAHAQAQAVTKAQQQQMALAMAHPNLQHPSLQALPPQQQQQQQQQQQPPPAPLSTYSDPTGASSTFFDGDMVHGGDSNGSTNHISPSQTSANGVAFPPEANGTTTSTAAAPRQRRPTASSLNFFKFDSPSGQHHSSAVHANGYEPAPGGNGADAAQAQALLTFMQLSAARNAQNGHHHHSGRDSFVVDASADLSDIPLSMISPPLFEPDLGMDDMQQQQGGSNSFEWRGLDLPMDIHDLLSGFSAY